MNIELLSSRLVAALVDGSYQGALVVVAVWAALKCWRRSNAATRYAAWFATLLIVTALPVLHFLYAGLDGAKADAGQSEVLVANGSLAPALSQGETGSVGAVDEREALDPAKAVSQSGATEALANTAGVDSDLSLLEETSNTTGVLREEAWPAGAEKAAVVGPSPLLSIWFGRLSALAQRREWRLEAPGIVSLILVLAWASLSVVRLAGLAGQVCLLRGLKRRAAAAPAQISAPFCGLVKKLGLSRQPRLLTSPEIPAPMVAGFLHPAVLLPQNVLAEASAPQLEQVLRHELAHVARGDDWANLLQQALGAVFFFHPGVIFVSRRMSAEREIACDDHALQAIRAPREYALFLTEFAGRMTGRGIAAAPAAWSNKSQLKERITMILDGKRNASPRLAGFRAATMTVGAALLAVLALEVAPRVALAESADTLKVEQAEKVEVAETVEAAEPVIAADTLKIENVNISTSDGLLLAEVSPSGPREKSDVHVDVHVDGPVIAPARPVPPVEPRHGRIAQNAPEAPAPAPAPRPRPSRDREETVEHRLERLEKMVEELLARDRGPRPPGQPQAGMRVDGKRMEIHGPDKGEWHGPDKAELDHIRDQAKRDAEQAHRDGEQARRDGEQARRDAEHVQHETQRMQKDMALNMQHTMKNDLDMKVAYTSERQALKAKKEAIENARRELDKQLEKLDHELQEQKQMMEDRDRGQRGQREEMREKERALRDQEHEKRDKEKEKADKDKEKAEKADKEKNKEKHKEGDDNASNKNSSKNSDNGPGKQ